MRRQEPQRSVAWNGRSVALLWPKGYRMDFKMSYMQDRGTCAQAALLHPHPWGSPVWPAPGGPLREAQRAVLPLLGPRAKVHAQQQGVVHDTQLVQESCVITQLLHEPAAGPCAVVSVFVPCKR